MGEISSKLSALHSKERGNKTASTYTDRTTSTTDSSTTNKELSDKTEGIDHQKSKIPDHLMSCRYAIETIISDSLATLERKSGIKSLKQLNRSERESIVARCDELRKEYDEKWAICRLGEEDRLYARYKNTAQNHLREQLHITQTDFHNSSLDEFEQAQLYYLLKGEEPDEHILEIIHRLKDPFYGSTDLKYERTSCELFCMVLKYGDSFTWFYRQLSNDKNALEYLLYKHPQILTNRKSDLLMDNLKQHLPQNNLRRMLTNIRNKRGETHIFKTKLWQFYADLFANRVEDLYRLLSVQDINGQTALHLNTSLITNLQHDTYNPNYSDQLYSLLSICSNNGKTVLHHFIPPEDVSKLLNKIYSPQNTDQLFELLSKQDAGGQTALFANTDPITKILAEIYTPRLRDDLIKLTSIKDKTHRTAVQCGDRSASNSLSSLIHRVINNEYLTSAQSDTSIIIIYNTNNRPGADLEAELIYDACRSAYNNDNITFEKNLTGEKTIELIKQSASATQFARTPKSLVVILASHGAAGMIEDFTGNHMKLSRIEEAMCTETLDGRPKMLITQCCQLGELSDHSPLYVPTHNDFCAVMSCISGQRSERGVFLTKLSEQIESSRRHEDIFKIVNRVTQAMKLEGHQQTPIVMSTLKAELRPTEECWSRKYM